MPDCNIYYVVGLGNSLSISTAPIRTSRMSTSTGEPSCHEQETMLRKVAFLEHFETGRNVLATRDRA